MRILMLLIFVLISELLYTQPKNILVGDLGDPCEPTIAINPKNTNQVVAGAVLDHAYWSADAGKTWKAQKLTSTYGVWGDPVLIFDTLGTAHYFHLSNPPRGNWIDRIVAQKSTDGGNTWSTGTHMGLNEKKAQDKHWAVCDPKTNTIYVTWTQFDEYGATNPAFQSNIRFSKSTDAGNTWAEPKIINLFPGNCVDSDSTTEGAVPAVGPNGEIYVAWGRNNEIVFDKSTDGGINWLDKDLFVAAQPGGWDYKIDGIYRCNGMPVTFCDLSNGPHRGRIYVNWSDQRNGDTDTDIWLVYSDNKGETWSTPKRVNDDGGKRQQFMCWATVDPVTGHLWLVWYDRRNTTGTNTDVYMAQSTDGGITFRNFCVSETPFEPNPNVFFGDYTNVSAVNNVVRPIWARLQGSDLSVVTALVLPKDVAQYVEESQKITETIPQGKEQIAAYEIRKNGTSRIVLWDETDGKILQIIDAAKKRTKGRYTIAFTPSKEIVPSHRHSVRVLNKRGKNLYTRYWSL